MRKILLLTVLALLPFQLNASASITPEESISSEYLFNHGYSAEMVRLVTLQKAQIMGEEYEIPETTHIYRPWQNCVRRFLMYLDTGLDDEMFMRHDIKYTSRWDSL